MLFFSEDASREQVQRAMDRDTTLTAWFKLNDADPLARQYLYGDIPAQYTWNKKTRCWSKHKYMQKLLTIGRI